LTVSSQDEASMRGGERWRQRGVREVGWPQQGDGGIEWGREYLGRWAALGGMDNEVSEEPIGDDKGCGVCRKYVKGVLQNVHHIS
jgi:hypothetical protein